MRLVLTFLTIIPLALFSQDNDSTKTRRLSIGLTFSPDYCYRTLKSDVNSIWIAASRDAIEMPKFGYSTGLKLAYRFGKNLSFGAGILFSDKGYKINKKYNWVAPNGSNGVGDPAIPMKQLSNYHYYYIDIPISLNYYVFSREKTGVYVFTSISPNIFLTQKTTSYIEYGDGHQTKNTSTTSGYSSVNLSLSAGFGYQANFSNKLFLKIESAYRRSITSIIDAPIKEYLYSAGLDIGLYYRL